MVNVVSKNDPGCLSTCISEYLLVGNLIDASITFKSLREEAFFFSGEFCCCWDSVTLESVS